MNKATTVINNIIVTEPELANKLMNSILDWEEARVKAAAKAEPKPVKDDNSSNDDSSDDGWDTEHEDLMCDVKLAKKEMEEKHLEVARLWAAVVRAQEEADQAETKIKEAEEEFKCKRVKAIKRCEEIKKEN